jgi:hypothetical protein
MSKVKHSYSFGSQKISMNHYPSNPTASVTHTSPEMYQDSSGPRVLHGHTGQGSAVLSRSAELIQCCDVFGTSQGVSAVEFPHSNCNEAGCKVTLLR